VVDQVIVFMLMVIYSFGLLPLASTFVTPCYEFLQTKNPKTIGFFYQNTTFPKEAVIGAIDQAPTYNLEVTFNMPYNPIKVNTDFLAFIFKLNKLTGAWLSFDSKI